MFQNVTAIKIKEVRNLAPVFRNADSTIHWINITIGFRNTYPLDSDLSRGWRYTAFEQPGPEH